MSPHLDIGGWNFLFTFDLIISATYVAYCLRVGIERDPDARLLLRGFALLCLGAAVRVGGWLPWRSILYRRDELLATWPDDGGFLPWSIRVEIERLSQLADWYRGFSQLWTAAGVLLTVLGMGVIMYPAFRSRTGSAGVFAVFVLAFAGALYATGAIGTWAFSRLL